jgi:thiamine pyrophosphokinase
MVSDYSTAFAITDSCELHIGEGRRFSIFSPDNSLKIKSRGLFWPLDNVVFDNWWKATLNVATEDIVSLEFSHPSIALIILD